MEAQILELQRVLEAKSREVAYISLQRHIALLKESQLKVERDKLRRSDKFDEAASKAAELERRRRLLCSYDCQLESLTDEALDVFRQITELEAEELEAQFQGLQSELRQATEGTKETKETRKSFRDGSMR